MPRPLSARLSGIPRTTVWSEFTPLALKHKAVNLGQGFPSYAPPRFVQQHLADVVQSATAGDHQYARSFGRLELVSYLTERYAKALNTRISEDNVIVQNGATHALNCATMALVSNGDEVIVFEPFFDVYTCNITLAGGTAVPVAMTPSRASATEWLISEADLRKAITPRTKCIILNTPQNVPGKVWGTNELEMVARVARDHDLYVLADEVYENMTYDGTAHAHFATLPGMWERTITISSSGKSLSATGWKIGWAVAPKELITAMGQIHAQQVFSVNTFGQLAAARSLREADRIGYFAQFREEYTKKRDLLCSVLSDAGLPTVTPQGTFFTLADISSVDRAKFVVSGCADPLDWQFCRWMTQEIGVTAIPVTAFCSVDSPRRADFECYARFAFCKDEELLLEAGRRLKRLKGS